MINRKQIIAIIGLIFFSLNNACKHDKQVNFGHGLPQAENKCDLTNDSCLFSIIIKDTSIIFADYYKSIGIKSFDTIGDLICSEIKAKHINPINDLPVYFLLDSLTPFEIYDKLTEYLKNIGIFGAYLKTNNSGFFVMFLPGRYDILIESVKLYGNRFTHERDVLRECQVITNQDSNSFPPPPPLPPGGIPFHVYKGLTDLSNIDSMDFCLVELQNQCLIYNNRKIMMAELSKNIWDKKFVFLKLAKTNTYNDLIKLIDLIEGINIERFNKYSLQKFNKKFNKLDDKSKREIKREFIIRYIILSLADQKFILKLKANPEMNRFNDY